MPDLYISFNVQVRTVIYLTCLLSQCSGKDSDIPDLVISFNVQVSAVMYLTSS